MGHLYFSKKAQESFYELVTFNTNCLLLFHYKCAQDSLAKRAFEEIIGVIQRHSKDSASGLSVGRYSLDRARKENNIKHQWGGLQSIAAVYNIAEDWTKGAIAVEALKSFTEDAN